MGFVGDVVNAVQQGVQSLPQPPGSGSGSSGDTGSSGGGSPLPPPDNPVQPIVALVQAIDTSVTPILTPGGPSPVPIPYPAGADVWLDSVLTDGANTARAMLSDLKDREDTNDNRRREIQDAYWRALSAAMASTLLICMYTAEQSAGTKSQNSGPQYSPSSGPPPSSVVPRVMQVVAVMLGPNRSPVVRSLAAQELERIARSLPGLARPWRPSPKNLGAVRPALERIEAVLAKWAVSQRFRTTAPDLVAATERLRQTVHVCVAHSQRPAVVRGNTAGIATYALRRP